MRKVASEPPSHKLLPYLCSPAESNKTSLDNTLSNEVLLDKLDFRRDLVGKKVNKHFLPHVAVLKASVRTTSKEPNFPIQAISLSRSPSISSVQALPLKKSGMTTWYPQWLARTSQNCLVLGLYQRREINMHSKSFALKRLTSFDSFNTYCKPKMS